MAKWSRIVSIPRWHPGAEVTISATLKPLVNSSMGRGNTPMVEGRPTDPVWIPPLIVLKKVRKCESPLVNSSNNGSCCATINCSVKWSYSSMMRYPGGGLLARTAPRICLSTAASPKGSITGASEYVTIPRQGHGELHCAGTLEALPQGIHSGLCAPCGKNRTATPGTNSAPPRDPARSRTCRTTPQTAPCAGCRSNTPGSGTTSSSRNGAAAETPGPDTFRGNECTSSRPRRSNPPAITFSKLPMA